ncbi:MAG: hypothetical protein AAF411_16420 [Myxococcota bacterium]
MTDPKDPLVPSKTGIPELDAWIREEQDAADLAPDVMARLRGALATPLAAGAASPGEASPPPDPSISPSGGELAAQAGGGLAGLKLAAVVGAAFVAGAVSGGVVVQSYLTPERTVRPVPIDAGAGPHDASVAEDMRVDAPMREETGPQDSAREVEVLVEERARPQRREPAPGRANIAAERAMIDAAQAALRRGEPRLALSTLERHRREFSRGALVEEREGLRVLALLRVDETRGRRAAERFRRRYPSSLFRSAIERSLREGAR